MRAAAGCAGRLPGNRYVVRRSHEWQPTSNVEQFLASRVVEYCSHVELARDGQVQFAAYDTFDSVCFWECISPGMLKAMKQEGLILGYRLTHA